MILLPKFFVLTKFLLLKAILEWFNESAEPVRLKEGSFTE